VFLATPLLGFKAPPSSSVRTQSVSFSCWLSAASPVLIVKPMALRAPLPSGTGLAAVNWFTWRIIASLICGSSASQGRQAEPKGRLSGVESGSTTSTRAGDSSSASWKSES
jgi:hypothetical protein